MKKIVIGLTFLLIGISYISCMKTPPPPPDIKKFEAEKNETKW